MTTLDELDKLRRSSKDNHKPFLFREHRPAEPPQWEPGRPLRFKSEPKDYIWHDEVMGDLKSGPEAIDDFILIKSDGFPTYNFAHIVDDHLMQISHVIRSQEFLPSVPKFLNLYESLGIEKPKLATLPYVLGPDGHKKLSKRDGAKDILDYKREGYLPEAVVSFLATLGWNDGTEQEIFTVDELKDKFSLSRVQHSGARFDEKRLEWVDGHFIRHKSLDELYELAEPFWPAYAKDAVDEYKKSVLGLVQERLKFFGELADLTWFFFKEPTMQEVRAQIIEADPNHLKAVVESLQQSDFSYDDIKNRLNHLLQSLYAKPAVLFSEIRGATTGAKVSPELFGSLMVLGKDKVLSRLEQALSLLQP
jgi:glutamyl-tRNA synthetase